MSFRFLSSSRLKRPADFQRVYQTARRTGDGLLLVFARINQLDRTRIGLSVSRKFGPAVRRNRIKRLLREAFRLSQQSIPSGMDLILIPRPGITPKLDSLQKSLIRSAGSLERKLGTTREGKEGTP